MTVFQPILPDSQDVYRIVSDLKRKLGISHVTSRVLVNRGICCAEQAKDFLNPSLDKLFNPFDIRDMDKAVRRIGQALKERQHITIYGDYDVDGITAASILYDFLSKSGCSVDVYLPDRHNEGYGINKPALEIIRNWGTDLLISVDCGITAVEEIDYAKELGMDVIITDHHQCGSMLPDAVAVVNPRRNPELYGEYQLAGVGVAGKLIHALGGLEALEEYLDLISLGTIADVVPLVGENRILVSKGLEKINVSPRPGIQALIEVSGLDKGKIDTGKVAFGLAPRLNAAGRIAHPKVGFSLLIAKTLEEALPLARQLEENNRQRQAIEANIIKEAEEMIHSHVDLSKDNIIILAHENWDSGVIGIAASKLTDKYNRPCILISTFQEEGTGSARSIDGFNLYEALYSCKELFLRFGGHQQAAGFSILVENIGKLREQLLSYARIHITEEMLMPKFYYDAVLNSSDINYDLIKELEKLQPYGTANPVPSFLLNDVVVEDSRKIGKEGNHLKMSIGLGQRLWDAVAFNVGEQSEFLEPNYRMSILTGLDKNEWKGVSKIQFLVKHMEVLIETQEDCKNFLRPFYFKFFDAFLASFMYNKQCKNDKWDIKSKNAVIHVDEVLDEFRSSRLGNLLIINTYDKAAEVLARFAAEGLLQGLTISYGNVNRANGIGLNGCILAPYFHEIPYRYYKKIYVIDEEKLFWSFQGLHDRWGDKVCRVMNNSEGMFFSEDKLKDYQVSRRDFVNLYKWLQSLVPGRNLWQNWDELLFNYNKMLKHKINGFQMRLILAVFEELGFIQISGGYRFLKIEYNQNPVHHDLEESHLYCYYKTWLGYR